MARLRGRQGAELLHYNQTKAMPDNRGKEYDRRDPYFMPTGMSCPEVAEVLGLSPERVRQIEFQALEKLAAAMEAAKLTMEHFREHLEKGSLLELFSQVMYREEEAELAGKCPTSTAIVPYQPCTRIRRCSRSQLPGCIRRSQTKSRFSCLPSRTL